MDHSLKINETPIYEFDSIRPLWEQLNRTHYQNSTYWKNHFEKLTFEKRIKGLQAIEKKKIFVATVEENLIAYCLVSIKGVYGEIDSIFVQENYRASGVGDKLATKALEWFAENSIQDIRVEVAEGNEKVLPFYEKLGFKRYMTTLKATPTNEVCAR